MHIWGTHLLPSYTTPMQPRGNKANTLFSPYVLLKRGLFDLKLIGQAWAQGLKARTAGLSTAAREMVEVGEESSSLFSPCIHLSIPRVQSIPLHLYPCLVLPFSTSPNLLASENWGALKFRVWRTVHENANGC